MRNNFQEKDLGPKFCQKQIKEIKKLINSSTSFSIVGLPSMGISIFLKCLACQNFAHFVHVDINELPKLSKQECFKLIKREIGGKAESKKQLEELNCQYERIILVFNRFDRLRKEFNEDFFSSLRVLRDVNKAKIVIIFATNKPLLEQVPEALSGGNLTAFSKSYYLKPYSNDDLKRLVQLNSPGLKIKKDLYEKAINLSGGHYQLLRLLLASDFLSSNPLWDSAVKLQLQQLYKYLSYFQRKQLQKIALGKQVKGLDPYLLNIGYVKEENKIYKLFTPLFSDFIKANFYLKLPLLESKLFVLLKSRIGKVVSHQEIFDSIWPKGEVTDWALNALIYRLKKNPSFVAKGFEIESQKKVGYRLVRA